MSAAGDDDTIRPRAHAKTTSLTLSRPVVVLATATLFGFAAFAMFWNLGDRSLWGDEAETALLAINITHFGIPKASDGKNYITILGKGRDTNADDVWVWSPWLDEYLAAASFALFGKSTFAARLPFAVAAFVAILFMPYLAYRMFRNAEAAIFAALLLSTNTWLLLHARQCRYYGVVLLAQLILLYGHYALERHKNRFGIAAVTAALCVQWYSNYVLAAANGLALLSAAAIHYSRRPRMAMSLLTALVATAALCVPWLLYARPEGQSSYLSVAQAGSKIAYYGRYTAMYIVPAGLAWALYVRRRRRSGETVPVDSEVRAFYLLATCMGVAHMVVLMLTPGQFYRYLLPVIPVCILVFAHAASLIQPRWARIAVVAVVFAMVHLAPLLLFVADITRSYRNSVDDVAAFLREHARPTDTVYVMDPSFPLIFYTDLKIVDGRLHPLEPNRLPEWILSEDTGAVGSKKKAKLTPELAGLYETITIPVRQSRAGDSNPEPQVHMWLQAEERVPFDIYRLKMASTPAP